jgi:signal transduction histidine kinase
MSIISGYAELLAEKSGDPESEAYLTHLNRAVERISTMAGEIIAFSKGERELLPTNVLIEELMQEFFDQIEAVLLKKQISLRTHMRTGGVINLDKEKMLRVFHNIVLNAAEAMDKGGALTVEVDRIEDEVSFSFTDTGPGIPEEIRGSVFQSFVTMGKRQGTGLGLAVAREIVEAHQGTIKFNTIMKRGTTFIVSIPVKRNAS